MKRRERDAARSASEYNTISHRIASQIQEMCGVETRTVIPGHIQRGGTPCAYDRLLSTQFGVHAAELIRDEVYGMAVALQGNTITHNKLADIAGKTKGVTPDHQVVQAGRDINITFGDR